MKIEKKILGLDQGTYELMIQTSSAYFATRFAKIQYETRQRIPHYGNCLG